MHHDESGSESEGRLEFQAKYARRASVAHGCPPWTAGQREIPLEDGMITCESEAT